MMSVVEAAVLYLIIFPLPLKIAANMVGAQRSGILACLVAMFLGVLLSLLVLQVALPHGPMAALAGIFIAVSVAYWLVLRPSLPAAFLLSILAAVVQFIIVYLLVELGLLNVQELQQATPQGTTFL